MNTQNKTSAGFTTIELMIGFAIGGIVLAGVYRLWTTNSYEGMRLQQKIELRNQMALSTKKLNQSIIEAGYGLDKVVGLAKYDAVGTDTLILYRNPSQLRTTLVSNYHGSQPHLTVANGSIFQNARFVVIAKNDTGEVRAIHNLQGSVIILEDHFDYNYSVAGTSVLPCTQDKYYTNQETQNLVRLTDGSPTIVGRKIHNFQVSFRDRNGNQTELIDAVRFVNYSLTGIYTAQAGALSSVVFSSTSIPRNLL